MFNDFSEILKEFLKKLLSSRLVILAVVFVGLYVILGMRLFNLQIMEGEQYQENYMAKTEKKISLAGTRGNIYDRNGNLLAYNKLSYNVTLQDNGDYKRSNDRNRMLLELVRILNRHGENVEGDFSVGYDSSGNMIFTTTSEAARKRFLSDYYGLKKTDELDDADGKYPSDVTAREVFDARVKYYGLDQLKDDNDNPIELTDEEALGIINIRYTMGLTAYRKYESTTDFFLIDTKDPKSTIGIGATGAVHDRNIDRAIVEATKVPCIVAGGLDASNVAEVIHITHPYGVDSCTRTNADKADAIGNGKDREKVKAFIEAARNA